MIRLTEVKEIEKIIEPDKRAFVKIIEKSKIPTNELKEFAAFKTNNLDIKTNDRKTLCRLITKFL